MIVGVPLSVDDVVGVPDTVVLGESVRLGVENWLGDALGVTLGVGVNVRTMDTV